MKSRQYRDDFACQTQNRLGVGPLKNHPGVYLQVYGATEAPPTDREYQAVPSRKTIWIGKEQMLNLAEFLLRAARKRSPP